MNILIVDDQKAIVEGLRDRLNWDVIGITGIHTAESAKEAKLVLLNFKIDILLTDIEMPEEDGISLLQWAKERYPETVGIFLTSHADFAYAKEAIKLGGFDYILQPARYEEVEKALARAVEEAKKKVHLKRLEQTTAIIIDQRDAALELLMSKEAEEKYAECEEIFLRLQEMFVTRFEHCVFYPCWIQVVRFEAHQNKWNAGLLKLVFRNVLEELLEEADAKVCIAKADLQNYLVYLAVDAHKLRIEKWQQTWEAFAGFFNGRMDFKIAVYPDWPELEAYRPERNEALGNRRFANQNQIPGVFREKSEELQADENTERIRMAEDYIKTNINRSISRAEVAEYLHLNEEYFSRLFKKYTGYTFKDYDMMMRIDTAKLLLEQTRFSVSIIASKVGYDNFSHFSRVFKRYTDKTPQEYRKDFQ